MSINLNPFCGTEFIYIVLGLLTKMKTKLWSTIQ